MRVMGTPYPLQQHRRGALDAIATGSFSTDTASSRSSETRLGSQQLWLRMRRRRHGPPTRRSRLTGGDGPVGDNESGTTIPRKTLECALRPVAMKLASSSHGALPHRLLVPGKPKPPATSTSATYKHVYDAECTAAADGTGHTTHRGRKRSTAEALLEAEFIETQTAVALAIDALRNSAGAVTLVAHDASEAAKLAASEAKAAASMACRIWNTDDDDDADDARAFASLTFHVAMETRAAVEELSQLQRVVRRSWAALAESRAATPDSTLSQLRLHLRAAKHLHRIASHCATKAKWGSSLCAGDLEHSVLFEWTVATNSWLPSPLYLGLPGRRQLEAAARWLREHSTASAIACATFGVLVFAAVYRHSVSPVAADAAGASRAGIDLHREAREVRLQNAAEDILAAQRAAEAAAHAGSGMHENGGAERLSRLRRIGSRLSRWRVRGEGASASGGSGSGVAAQRRVVEEASAVLVGGSRLSADCISKFRGRAEALRGAALQEQAAAALRRACALSSGSIACGAVGTAGVRMIVPREVTVIQSGFASTLTDAANRACGDVDRHVPGLTEEQLETLLSSLADAELLSASYVDQLCAHIGPDARTCALCLGALTPSRPLVRSTNPACGKVGGHVFHAECLPLSYAAARGCPLCRRPVDAYEPANLTSPFLCAASAAHRSSGEPSSGTDAREQPEPLLAEEPM